VCGSDERNWQLATRAAVQALEARIALWDGTLAAIESRRPAVVTR
jgi:hypothetical protein